MSHITEDFFIENLVKKFARSPLQINEVQESDAELITIPGTKSILAITTDSIVEEIERGLYNDPYLIGWMTVMACMSDIAAVGALPVGILLNQTLPPNIEENDLNKIQKGISDACIECDIQVLGGDTNFSNSMQMSGCGIGFIDNNSYLTRKECKSGDFLFSTGRMGQGNAYALFKLLMNEDYTGEPISYKPKAKLDKGQLICDYSNCCMDTSDGFISTIDQLTRLNSKGFVIEKGLKDIIHSEALELSKRNKLPGWVMLAAPHGEFELLFTIAPDIIDSFLDAAKSIGWEPLRLGTVVNKQGLNFKQKDRLFSIDTHMIRNLFEEVNGDIEKYVKELLRFDEQWPHD